MEGGTGEWKPGGIRLGGGWEAGGDGAGAGVMGGERRMKDIRFFMIS